MLDVDDVDAGKSTNSTVVLEVLLKRNVGDTLSLDSENDSKEVDPLDADRVDEVGVGVGPAKKMMRPCSSG